MPLGYTNRIFGIGKELTVEGLNQKQSQSQMANRSAYNFLVVSKGAIATTNTANTGVLAEGDYLVLGDNDGPLVAQSTEIPASYAASVGCTVNRFGSKWKVQITGNSCAGSYSFSGSASGIVLIVDTDGDFSNATTTYPATSVVNGVATFDNITLNNGNVFTFGWTVVSPRAVSTGLKLWTKADDTSLVLGNVAQWNDLSSNVNYLDSKRNSIKSNATRFIYYQCLC